jgi:protein-disulfide isomerase
MHDAMFKDQSSLNESGLKEVARQLGLDVDGFAACLGDPGTKNAIDAQTRAADELSITSTPYFFINGRPLSGSVPAEQFEAVITDELRRVPRHG